MDNLLLTIDCGTQSLRALLFQLNGELIDKVQICYEPYFSTRPGWAEQDPEVFWRSLCEATRALKEKHPDIWPFVSGVGVTTQRDSMVNVDSDGNPLRPVITWLDQRKAEPVYKPGLVLRSIFKLIGIQNALTKIQASAKCNWIRQNEPDIWSNTHKYLQVSGFLNHRLTGIFKDSIASQIGHIPFDYKKMKWATGLNPALKLFPVEPEKLPETVPAGDLIGHIRPDASLECGIPAGIPVIACGSDKGCETLGMGVTRRNMASLSFGTTATVQTTTDKYFEPIRFMPPYPAPIPGRYNPEIEIFRGFWMITWFKNEFAHKEVEAAAKMGVVPEVVLNDLLKEAPPGSMGLIVQPYWGPGLSHPVAKGSMIGFGDVHKKAHVYRAVIEGLGYALYEGLLQVEKAGKTKIDTIAVSGGASQSDEICQITADIFNRPMVRGCTPESSGLGAAIVTAVGLKLYGDFDEAVKAMVRTPDTFYPDPVHVPIYKKLYKRVYQRMYGRLKPLYEDIKDITGYPE